MSILLVNIDYIDLSKYLGIYNIICHNSPITRYYPKLIYTEYNFQTIKNIDLLFINSTETFNKNDILKMIHDIKLKDALKINKLSDSKLILPTNKLYEIYSNEKLDIQDYSK